MDTPLTTTRFANFPKGQARAVLAFILVAVVGCVAISLSSVRNDSKLRQHNDSGGDAALYRAVIDRIATGEGYYAAASTELQERGYPTRSVFNWRTPLPMWMIGALPNLKFSKAILGALALATLVLSFALTARDGGPIAALVGPFWMVGALYFCLQDPPLMMPSIWAGVLITLSIATLGLGQRTLGVLFGIAAVFFRELAGLYCFLCFLYALRQRRWKEAAGWSVGMLAYAAFFAWHVAQVTPLIAADARAHEGSWLQLGGIPFVISTAQMHGVLLPPDRQWIAAIYLPLAILGFIAWKSDAGKRAALVAIAYLLLFAFVGHPFNQYWGSLLAPTLCLGFAFAPRALYDLWQSAFGDQTSAEEKGTVARS